MLLVLVLGILGACGGDSVSDGQTSAAAKSVQGIPAPAQVSAVPSN